MKHLIIAALAALALQSCGDRKGTQFHAKVLEHVDAVSFKAVTSNRDTVLVNTERARLHSRPRIGLCFDAVGYTEAGEPTIHIKRIVISK